LNIRTFFNKFIDKLGPLGPVYEIPVESGEKFTLKAMNSSGEGKSKAYLCQIKYFDKSKTEISANYPHTAISDKHGAYVYFHGGTIDNPREFISDLEAPHNATMIRLVILPWASKERVRSSKIRKFSLEANETQANKVRIAEEKKKKKITTPSNAKLPINTPLESKGKKNLFFNVPNDFTTPSDCIEFHYETHEFHRVQITGSFSYGEPGNGRSFIVLVRCYDVAGAPILIPFSGLKFSEKWGNFLYLAGGEGERPFEFNFNVELPKQAAQIRIIYSGWQYKGSFSPPEHDLQFVESRKQQIERCRKAVSQQVKLANASNETITVITSTTKPIGTFGRLNRPQMMAAANADLGNLTCYVYYRFANDASIGEINIKNDTQSFIQIPSDIFHEIANEFASVKESVKKILLVSIPDAPNVLLTGIFQEAGWKTIYECRDDWEEFKKEGVGKWYEPQFERYLCLNCDVITAVSPFLKRKLEILSNRRVEVSIIPNATTQEFIKLASPYRRNRLQSPSKTSKKVVGYFGHLTEAWLDWELLFTFAKNHPDIQLDMIGFGGPEILPGLENLHIRGPYDHHQLPEETKEWDIAIIPFRIGALAQAVDPIKVYEYAALGIPTVSAPMGNLESLPFVHIYQNSVEFSKCIEAAFNDSKTGKHNKEFMSRIYSASWQTRMQDTLDKIKNEK